MKWVSRLLDETFHPWKIIPNLFFSRVGGNKTIFHFNLQLSEACLAKIKNFPLFYQQLIQIWARVNKRDPTQTSDPTSEICKEVLWNNASINSKCEHPPPGNPRGFAPIFSPGPGDLYHLNCPGVARVPDLLSKYQVVS